MEFTIEECEEWLEDKDINPRTKKAISENGNIYKKLMKSCIKHKLIEDDNLKNFSINEMRRLSKIWSENKNINPIDGSQIKPSSKIYKKFKFWYITFYNVKDMNVKTEIKKIADELNTDGIDVDEYLMKYHPNMMKYKTNILRELNKM